MDRCPELQGRITVYEERAMFIEFFEWLPVIVGGSLLFLSGFGPWFLVGIAGLASGAIVGIAAGRESRAALWRSLCRGLARAVGNTAVVSGYVVLGKRGVAVSLRLENGVDIHFWGGLAGMWSIVSRSPVYIRGRAGGPAVWSLPCRPRRWSGRLSYGVVHPLFGWRARIYGRGGVSSVFCPLGVLDDNLVARVVVGALDASY